MDNELEVLNVILARASQLISDAAEFEDCETLEDYQNALGRLKLKAEDLAAKSVNYYLQPQNA